MKRKITALALGALLFALCGSADAQQPAKVPRIGFLNAPPIASISARLDAFRQGLGKLGYAEGKNIIIEYRSAEGKNERVPELAAELVRLQVDVIVSSGPTSTHQAKKATSTIPIVMAFDDDPVGSGLVASLARPGGNITGLSTLSPETSGKQLELLKEIIPRLSRVAVLGTSNRPGTAQGLRETELAAGTLGVQLQYLDVLSPKDIEVAFREARSARADAVLVLGSPIHYSDRKRIVELAAKSRLPATYNRLEYVEEGGLMTYGVNISDLFRRSATYVDKILKGRTPADLPCGATD